MADPRYTIFQGNYPGELEDMVRRAMEAGWEPAGGMAAAGYGGGMTFYQAMIRPPPTKDFSK